MALPVVGNLRETDFIMTDLAATFLDESERDQVVSAVREVETITSGEIVPMVVAASYHYPLADLLAAATFAFPAAVLLTPVIGGHLWLGPYNMWVFIGLCAVLFSLAQPLVKRIPGLKRLFVANREMDEEVEEAAVTAFFRHGLYRTREGTGVLIFLSVFERKVWVLADHGINSRVDSGVWDEVVQTVVRGIKTGQQATALCDAIRQVGSILEEHFPVRADDRDELRNLIIES